VSTKKLSNGFTALFLQSLDSVSCCV